MIRSPLTYTPPDLPPEPDEAGRAPVSRRHVFYFPGYDRDARSRYRLLFVRELTLHAKRFGEGKWPVSPARTSPDRMVQGWSVAPHPQADGVAVQYDVLHWDDIVLRDMGRPRLVSMALLTVGTLHALVRGALARFYRYNRLFGTIIVYPFMMVAILAVLSLLLAALVHALLTDGFSFSLHAPGWIAWPVAVAVPLAAIRLADPLLHRAYFWQLLGSWVFSWQHGQGWRADYRARLDAFAERVLARVAEGAEPPDEIVLVGHSSGAMTAVEVAARLIARAPDLGEGRPALALLTLGSAVPLVAIQPQATRLRADIASLVTSSRIAWFDVQAPQDWMNFPGFNPVLDLDLGPSATPVCNPMVRSAGFKQMLSEETYRKVRFRPFRMHFQFLLANERAAPYDYFRLLLGPRTLRACLLRTAAEPGDAAG